VFLKRLAQGAPLNRPWGFAVAPKNFGPLSNALLISNNTKDGIVGGKQNVARRVAGDCQAGVNRAQSRSVEDNSRGRTWNVATRGGHQNIQSLLESGTVVRRGPSGTRIADPERAARTESQSPAVYQQCFAPPT